MMTTILVAVLVSLVIGSIVFVIVRKNSTKVATAVATQVADQTLRMGWPHPWVGQTVAYRFNPSRPIGKITRVDGSGRARIKRYGTTSVRRKIDRLVIYQDRLNQPVSTTEH